MTPALPAYPALADLLPRDGDLRLRPWRPDDVEAVLAACSDPTTQAWVAVFRGYGRADAEDYVLGAPADWERRRHLRLCLSDGEDRVLGSFDLDDLRLDHGRAEAGWWVAPGARGRGYAVRGARLLLATAFDVVGLHRVFAEVVAGNPASAAVAATAGMRHEGTAREAWRAADGRWHDVQVFGLLARDRAPA